jgi:tetratricopeptide (TPR) repeat protein
VKASEDRLEALAVAIAEGATVDWRIAESAAGSAEELAGVRALASIEAVAAAHRSWLTAGAFSPGLGDEDEETLEHWAELEILERVGGGAFGDVYRARDPRLDRIVALKLLRTNAAMDQREEEILGEARLLAQVRHPNIAVVHGAAAVGGRIGFWMEFLEGKNLAQLLREGGLFDERRSSEVGIALLRALAAVHSRGIVHGDVKAQNVMIENDGRIVLADFGVGRELDAIENGESCLSGTPLYLAPELFAGKSATPASDLYSLGVLLFHLTTGAFPVNGYSLEGLRSAHQQRGRRALLEARPGLDKQFATAVERALERDPLRRQAWAREIEGDLLDVLSRENEVAIKKSRHGRQLLIAAGTAFLCLLGIAGAARWDQIVARSHLYRAQNLHAEGRLQEAIGELEDAIRLDPKLIRAYLDMVSYKSGIGDYVGSLRIAEKATSFCQGSANLECLLAMARLHLLRMQYKEALGFFSRAARIADDDDIQKEIVMLQVNLCQPELGLEAANGLERSNDVVLAGEKALLLAESNRPNEAQRAVTRLRQRFAGDDYLRWVAGIVHIAAGRAREAESEFQALATRPKESGFASSGRLLWAQTLLYQGRLGDAERVLLEGVSVEPRDGLGRNEAVRWLLLAKCYLLSGDEVEAARVLGFLRDQAKIPTNLKIFRNGALIALDAGDQNLVEEFIGIIGAIAKAYPSDMASSFEEQLQGERGWRSGDFGTAVRHLEAARKLRDDPQNSLSLARARVAQGRPDLAEPYLEEIVWRRGLVVSDFYTPWTLWVEARRLLESSRTRTKR